MTRDFGQIASGLAEAEARGPADLILPPIGEETRLSVLVVQLVDRMKQTIRDIGEELGLSVAQLDVLRQLYARGATPMSRLAEILNCEASNLTGLVDRLEGRGLVERQPDPADRRVKLLVLTEAGEKASHEAWFAVSSQCPFMDLPDERRRLLEGLLEEALSGALAG